MGACAGLRDSRFVRKTITRLVMCFDNRQQGEEGVGVGVGSVWVCEGGVCGGGGVPGGIRGSN